MEVLSLHATPQTPEIYFDPIIGSMNISGRAIPDSPDDFWLPVLNWFESYAMNPCPVTTVKINLDYFNISSSKRILFLLYKLNELVDNGFEVAVHWHYRKEDEDMYEVGQDYAYMVRVPFEFLEYQDPELAIA